MSAAGEVGLRFLDTLYGRPAQPWTCSWCKRPQDYRRRYEHESKPVCAVCFWRLHEEDIDG